MTQRRNKDGSIVQYYALAENVWNAERGRSEAKAIYSFGRADRLDKAVLERLAGSLRRVLLDETMAEADRGQAAVRLDDIEIEAVFELGVVHLVKALWNKLGIADAIASRIEQKRLKAPHLAALLTMVVQRLVRPGSKLACHERFLERVWLPESEDLALGQLYRALDLLAEHGDDIEREVFWNSVDLFKLDVDLVFYDATAAWFETDEEDIASQTWRGLKFEPLRKRGHSKEGRDNDPQIVIAMAVTRDGIPVRSWVFPGNTPDVTTVEKVKDDLRDMRLGRTLFVGDAGMYSKDNLDELSKGASKYILATPIRRIKEVKDEVLSHPGRYAEIAPNLRAKEVIVGDGERRRRYILCLNEEEADRQKWRRAELITTLKAELAALKKDHPKRACQLLASKRFGPYLSQNDSPGSGGRPFLDQTKVKRAEHLDGKFVLTTNDDSLSVADIALGYKGMWIIESCFRAMKTTDLEVRPMFHWVGGKADHHRITAHVKLCVLALMIQRAVENATDLTWRQIQAALEPLKAVQITTPEQTIVQSGKITKKAATIPKKLDISVPKRIISIDSTKQTRESA